MKTYIIAILLTLPTCIQAQETLINDTVIVAGETVMVNGDEVQDIGTDNNIDSLLSLWYLQRAVLDTGFIPLPDSFVVDIPDSVYINRLKAMPCVIKTPYNHLIRNHITHYTQRISTKTEMILGLAEFYMPQIEEILDLYGVPIELRAMAVIESALNPRAVSRAKAKGMWQFMYNTAKLYDVTMNDFVDERFDPIASTHAAARHMKDLYSIFNDWNLAIAAYNCGAGNVHKAIRRSGGKLDYWDIYPYLPRETRGYLPAFVAANYVLHYYKEHNLIPKKFYTPAPADTFMVSKWLHFEQVAKVAGIPIDELRNYNPQYLHDIIPGSERPYVLRIPYQYTAAFTDKETEIYAYKDTVYFNPNIIKKIAEAQSTPASLAGGNKVIHQVRQGETLGGLAVKYHVKTADIRDWNNIRGNMIRLGQKIVIYTKKAPEKAIASAKKPVQNTPKYTPQSNKNGNVKIHVVKEGETLWSISQIYDNITCSDLMKLNGMNANSKIYPGDKIKVKLL